MSVITFISKDAQEVKVENVNAVLMSETVKSMMDLDEPPYNISEDPIPLEAVNAKILEEVFNWCVYHDEHKEQQAEKEKYDEEFINRLDDDTLFELILAANYLDIKPLLDLICKTVANYIKQCKTPQEIRKRFNIKNDFTPEEEAEVRMENAWCEER